MTVQDIVVCVFAFTPTGWGMLLVRLRYEKYFMLVSIIVSDVGK